MIFWRHIKLGIEALGVGYGYGRQEELQAAEPQYMAATVAELQAMFADWR